jgi:formamidopyrimidine-DNA glycosylase
MPELPDLQVFSSNLDKKLSGKAVKEVKVVNEQNLKASVADLKKSIEGQAIKKIYREGKELHIAFRNGEVLGLHLMLRGRLHLFEEKNKEKNTIIELLFDDDTGLAMTDYQGKATPTLNPEVRDSPDALSKEVNLSFLKKTLAKSRKGVKAFLLDQNIIRGIGNAYADEILYEAGISPFSVGNKIPEEKLKDLAEAIKNVLQDAEKEIKKADPEIISGELRDFLKVHTHKKTKTPTGGTIKVDESGSRKTYYSDEQELYK